MKKIAVLITCFNRKQNTIDAIKALLRCNLPLNFNLDVFLVDDGSTDGTAHAIKNAYPDINIIQGTGDLFWNRGMHLAWQNAVKHYEYDYYLWLNDDTFLYKDGLKEMFEASLKSNEIIVGSTQDADSKVITYGGRTESGQLIQPNGSLQSCAHFNGNAVLISKKIYKKVGVLDPVFHHAIGDFDYGLRAKKKGISSRISPHFVGSCQDHINYSKWCQVERPLQERIKELYKTTCDCNPKQFFIFESRHYGLFTAIKHYISIHLRVFFPRLWKNTSY